MNAYMEFWRRYSDFAGKTSRRDFWMAYLWHIIVCTLASFLIMIVSAILLVGVCGVGADTAAQITRVLVSAYGLISLVPFLAMVTRRLRDAGYSMKTYLWLLIPGFGMVAIIARLCEKSTEN